MLDIGWIVVIKSETLINKHIVSGGLASFISLFNITLHEFPAQLCSYPVDYTIGECCVHKANMESAFPEWNVSTRIKLKSLFGVTRKRKCIHSDEHDVHIFSRAFLSAPPIWKGGFWGMFGNNGEDKRATCLRYLFLICQMMKLPLRGVTLDISFAEHLIIHTSWLNISASLWLHYVK